MTAVQPPAPAEHPAAGAGLPPAPTRRTGLPEGCPCQWTGPSAYCLHGQHDQCSTRPTVHPVTWLRWPDGRVAAPAPSTSVQVWRTGRPCTKPPCSCDCHTVPAEPVQGVLPLEVA